ncbi:hypothetical protein A3D08_02995 [Candidatus Roizmanbacteria bacterium RIFCSPHIGHO2_02_FULL_43_11]|uniref:PIN domain-containing protein n=1 Tax=Candidatus Roizmanbacteria bacterium RIFCSPHIGHO2_02_FULL_43_11 TaxID=1802043 RepID=A0A1F7HKI2_9BACT|nr:MAG: hypothetical protein A3D08_02995 [Candidatus Roizmanbacteria bacterium RIFCSPHIGHO2_02_FULL_43_11]
MVSLKRNNLFVDTNYFVSLVNEHDTNNTKACAYAEEFVQYSPQFIISNYIFSEVVTVTSQRLGKDESIRVGTMLLSNPHIEILPLNTLLEREAWKIFSKIAKKNMSYVDCTTLALIKAYKIERLLTFDRKDFQPIGKDFGFVLV